MEPAVAAFCFKDSHQCVLQRLGDHVGVIDPTGSLHIQPCCPPLSHSDEEQNRQSRHHCDPDVTFGQHCGISAGGVTPCQVNIKQKAAACHLPKKRRDGTSPSGRGLATIFFKCSIGPPRKNAPVAQRIEQWSSEPPVGVRFPPGALGTNFSRIPINASLRWMFFPYRTPWKLKSITPKIRLMP